MSYENGNVNMCSGVLYYYWNHMTLVVDSRFESWIGETYILYLTVEAYLINKYIYIFFLKINKRIITKDLCLIK